MKGKAIKIFIPIICILLAMVLLVVCFITCAREIFSDKEVQIRYDGYFKYIIVGENSRYQDENDNTLAIVGFTKSGLEQEVIDIPREINGKIVEHIGFMDEGHIHNNSHSVYCSANLKKIFINDNIKNMAYFYGTEVDIMVCSGGFRVVSEGYVSYKRIFIYKSLFDGGNYFSNVFPANIVFMNNYSDEVNDGYYRLDNIDTGEKIPVPPSPVRSGYEFTGWYTDSECINAWDFDVSPDIEDDTEFRLYARWRAK